MANELTTRPTNAIAGIEQAKDILRLSDDVGEIAGIHGLAQAAEVYARAQGAKEKYMEAAEVKLLAERRAGEIRRQLPRRHGISPRFNRGEAKRMRELGMTQREVGQALGVDASAIGYAERNGWGDGIPGVPLDEFDAKFGVTKSSAYDWEKLSEIPEDRFATLLEDAKEKDLSMTAKAFVRREGLAYETRLEPGIYRIRDGRLAIRWNKGGIARYKTLDTEDLSVARKALAKARGDLKERRVRSARTIGDAYALVRRALQTLDAVGSSLEPDARRATDAAIGHLHRAEDELVKASNTFPRRTK